MHPAILTPFSDLLRVDTVGYEPQVSYFFGVPILIEAGGVVLDIPLFNISGVDDGDAQKKAQFAMQRGVLSSALEHAVPEQMFVNEENPGEAISAVKALQKANEQGQKIYQITQANQSTTLSKIHHDSATMVEITNALNAGKEVIIHADVISVPGWSGAGYIIIDQKTGDGAYKIAGGANGGWLMLQGLFAGYLFPACIFLAFGGGLLGVLSLLLVIVLSIYMLQISLLENSGCFWGGYIRLVSTIKNNQLAK